MAREATIVPGSAATHDLAEAPHEGPLAPGQEVPFSLRIPADALPNWDQPATAEMGTPVPVTRDAGVWRGPEPSGEGEVKVSVKRWDVAIDPDRWSLQRGEGLTVGVEIGKPDPRA